jgi:Glycosyl transferases group 1
MYAGVPPVVFPFGGAARTVTHNVTGLVVPDAAAYGAAIEWLYHHPAERARLGRNAQEEARRYFGPETAALKFNTVYDGLISSPKRARAWSGPARSGAGYFVESLSDQGADFAASLGAQDLAECLAAEARIYGASSLLASAAAGGILNYRNFYLNDAYLRLWAGLVLHGQGRPALAVAEFNAAARLGLSHWRVAWYRARSAEACGAWQLAAESVEAAVAAAPEFGPARALAARVAPKSKSGVSGAIPG